MARRGREQAVDLASDASPVLERGRETGGRLAREASPLIDRVTRRERRSRKRTAGMVVGIALLMAVAGTIVYLLWQRRDEEPAYLEPQPDTPDTEPAAFDGPPSVGSGPGGRTADEPTGAQDERTPAVGDPAREYSSVGPTARAGDGAGVGLPPLTAQTSHAPFAPAKDQLPRQWTRPELPR